jgi:hypothetical protein
MSEFKNWFRDNQVIVIALIGQAIIAGIYMVNLEARVSTLEVRGSPHLSTIDNRLTVLESKTDTNADSIKIIKEIMTRKLNINP